MHGTGVSDNVTQRHSRARGQREPTGIERRNERHCHESLDIYSEANFVGDSVGFGVSFDAERAISGSSSNRETNLFFPCRVPRHNAGAKIDGGDGDNVACETRNRMAI